MKKILYILVFLVLGSSNGQLLAQSFGDSKVNVRIPISTKKSLTSLPGIFYRENFKNDSLDLEIAVSELPALKDQYPEMKILPNATRLDASDMAVNMDEALTFTKYPTYSQYDSMMHYFADTYPTICKIDTFGFSVEDRLLLAVKISDNVNEEEDEPAFLYTSTMHGDELVGYVLSLRLIDFILSSYGDNAEIDRIVDDLEIWINPLSNPDYTYYGSDATLANSVRPDSRNLNRGFPNPGAAEENDTSGLYLENQYMMVFMNKHGFNLSANIHSGAEVVNYPWDYKYELHPDDEWFKFISREYADQAHDVNPNYMDGFSDGITNGADWYVIFGGRQDYVSSYLHGREVTLELSDIKKVASETLDTYWNYNKWSLINLISQARYGIHGNVFNASSGKKIAAEIRVLNHDNESSIVISNSLSGNFYRYLKEGIYDLLISSEGYFTDTIRNVEVFDYQKTELLIGLESDGTALDTKSVAPQLNAYPNPASKHFFIEKETPYKQNMLVEIYSSAGSLVRSFDWMAGDTEIEIDLSGLEEGFWLLKISGTETFTSLNFIIQR